MYRPCSGLSVTTCWRAGALHMNSWSGTVCVRKEAVGDFVYGWETDCRLRSPGKRQRTEESCTAWVSVFRRDFECVHARCKEALDKACATCSVRSVCGC